MPENEGPDKVDETPDTGQVEPSPDSASEIAEAALKGDTGSEEVKDEVTEALEGADSTVMTDPVLEAIQKDERFKGADFKSGDDALKSFAEARGALGRVDEERRIGRQFMTHSSEFEEFLKSKEKPQEEPEPVWNPPAMPSGIEQELAKPEDQRDPEKIRGYADRARYIQDKWGAWTEDPQKLMKDLVLPAVDRLVMERFTMRDRETSLRKVVDGSKEFLTDSANYQEVEGLSRPTHEGGQGVPLELAIELAQLRHGAKKEKSEEAKDADLVTLEKEQTGPNHVEEPEKLADGVPQDARAIAHDALRRAGIPLQ